MNENYDFKNIERNCQSDWQKNDLFSSKKDLNKKKYYVLSMFPYPS